MTPTQKPGRSKQDYGTPPEFLAAVKSRLGIDGFAVDLAADRDNSVADEFYTSTNSALLQRYDWLFSGWCWCNPPYARIGPWVEKAYVESRRGARVAMLLPAGVGANWWREWVHGKAFVLLLNGRITFVGETAPYPKDCALLLYGPDIAPGYDVWTWAPRNNQQSMERSHVA